MWFCGYVVMSTSGKPPMSETWWRVAGVPGDPFASSEHAGCLGRLLGCVREGGEDLVSLALWPGQTHATFYPHELFPAERPHDAPEPAPPAQQLDLLTFPGGNVV